MSTKIDYGQQPELIREGMGVTLRTGAGGLYRPYTIIAVKRGGRELVIQADKVEVVKMGDPYADNGEKRITPDARGRIEVVTLRKDGTFIVKGTPMEWYSTRYTVGVRRDWTDYSV